MGYVHECNNEAISGWFDALSGNVLDLAYVTEGELDDIQKISEIYSLIQDIEREIACIEKSRDKYIDSCIDLRKRLNLALARLGIEEDELLSKK